jgi:hypothetical protein
LNPEQRAEARAKARRDREAAEITRLLIQSGGHEELNHADPRDPTAFEVIPATSDEAPHHVGGFIIDGFGQWPPVMRKHAETLTARGYRVKVLPYYDSEILEVWPPPKPDQGARVRPAANFLRKAWRRVCR